MKKNKSEKPLTTMQKFTLFFFDRTRFTLLFWASLLLFGAVSYGVLMRREGFPSVAPSVGVVNGVYFVDDAGRVDREITKPLSDTIAARDDVKSVTSSAGANFYVIQVEFNEGSDAATALSQIEESAKSTTFPQSATIEAKPIRFDKFSDEGDDLLLALYSKNNAASADELLAKANELSAYINEKSTNVDRAKTFDLYRVGTDPETGEERKQQISFDRFAITEKSDFSQYKSVTVGIKAKDNVDAIKLYDEIELLLSSAQEQSFMAGFGTNITADFAEGIREQIGSLQENLIGGLLAVLLVSFLLINARASFLTAVSMVAVLATTVGLLYLFGYTLNTITLFSLILCLGLIVDDTTIMVEAIDAYKKQKKTKREVIATAVKRVAKASTAGTFTTILGFAPMLFIGGILGGFVRAIPITVILSLLMSLLVSLALIPFMAKYTLFQKKVRFFDTASNFNPIPAIERLLSNRIAHLIRLVKRSRRKGIALAIGSIVISFGFIMLSGYFFSRGKFNIFPATKDTDGLIVAVEFKPGTGIEESEKIVANVTEKTGTALGDNMKEISLYASGSERATTMYVQLVSYKEREAKSPQLRELVTVALSDIEGAVIAVNQQDVGPPVGAFSVRLYTEDPTSVTDIARDIAQYLETLELKRPDGSTVLTKNTKIASNEAIVRDDAKRYIEITTSFTADDTSALVALAQTAVEDTFTPEVIAQYGLKEDILQFDFGGEEDNQESFKTMIIAFPVLLLAMYILLLVQFKSLLQPLLIFSAIPFSFFGVAAGLYYTDNPLSFFVMIGFFALIGISVNNTILLTDYANQEKAKGLGSVDAIAEAVKERFRPLLTTSITSIVALVPLVLADPFWESLGVTLIFGLLSSTVLVIISFPYYYLGAEWLRHRISRKQVLVMVLGNIVAFAIFNAITNTPLLYVLLFNAGVLMSRYAGKRKNQNKRRPKKPIKKLAK